MSHLIKSQTASMQQSDRELSESLRTAIIRNEVQRIKTLLKKINVDHVLDANRKTALYLASQFGNQKVVKLVLNTGANPNHRCIDGSTPVHAACYSGESGILSLLVEAGGDIRLHDNDGRGVKEWAMKHIDDKKARAVLLYIEELYRQIVAYSDSDTSESPGATLVPGQKKRPQKQQPVSKKPFCTYSFGFGAIGGWSEGHSGEPSMIPIVSETALTHDSGGLSYRIGTYVVMESMFWNKVVPVTVKRLRRTSASMECYSVDELINENNHMLHIRHPNILLFLAVCPVDRFENIFLIYERVLLGSLHTLVHHKGVKLSRKTTCTIMMQVCDAVSYLHYKELIHSYITPNAIQVMASYECVKLGNFEYMVDSDANEAGVPVTRSFPMSDTNWLAPEIFAEKAVTKKSDVYGVCIVMWEILHDKKPFAGLLTSEIEFLVMEAQDRVLPISASTEMPFHMLLDLGLKCDPVLRSCKIKDIHDAMAGAVTTMAADEPQDTKRKSTGTDKRCSLGCLQVSDQNDDLKDLSIFQETDDKNLIEQHEWHSGRRRNRLSEQQEPSGSDGEYLTVEETPVVVTGGARLHKAKAFSKLVKDRRDLKSGDTSGVAAEDVGVNFSVSDDDLPSAATEADPFETEQGWLLNRQSNDSSLLLDYVPHFRSILPENQKAVAQKSNPNMGAADNKNLDDAAAGFITVFDKNKLTGDMASEDAKRGDAEKAAATKQATVSSGKGMLNESVGSALSFDEFFRANAGATYNMRGYDSTLHSGFDSERSSNDLASTDQKRSQTLPSSKELSGKSMVDPTSQVESDGRIQGSSGSRINRSSLSSAVQLRHSIESMKRAFFCGDNSAGASNAMPQNGSADAKSVPVDSRKSKVSTLSQRTTATNVSTVTPQESKVTQVTTVTPQESKVDSHSELASMLASSESAELLKAFASKPLPPLPRSYIKPMKPERLSSGSKSGEVAEFANQVEAGGTDQWSRSPLHRSVLQESRAFSYMSRPNQRFGLGFQMTAPNSICERQYESPGVGSMATETANSKTPLIETLQRSIFMDSGIVLHRAPNSDVAPIYKSPCQEGGNRPLPRNFDFMTGFKPASHHLPSMVAPHLSKRTYEHLFTSAAFISPRATTRFSVLQDDSTGLFGYRMMQDQQLKEQEEDSPRVRLSSNAKTDPKAKRETQVTKDPEQRTPHDSGLKQDDGAESSDAACSMASASQPSRDIQDVSVHVLDMESVQVNGELDVDGKERVGDTQVMTSKEGRLSGANLEVQDTQRPESHRQGASVRAGLKLPVMKVGTSLTTPSSDVVSRLIGDADAILRFKSDPLLQRDNLMKKLNKPEKKVIANQVSDETGMKTEQMSNMGDIVQSGGKNDIKLYATNAPALLGLPRDSVEEPPISINKTNAETDSGICEVSGLLKTAIADALDKIVQDCIVSQCPCCSIDSTTIQ